MAEISMNKVIHNAVRRDLTRFLDALDRFPAGDQARARQLATAWANFDDQLTQHHEGEHEIVWPAIEAVGVTQAQIAEMDEEHQRLADALATASTCFAALARSASAADAAAARQAVETVQTVGAQHMEHEETDLEPIYLTKKDDPAIKAMERKFRRTSLPVTGTFLAWITDGATSEEMTAIKQNVPAPAIVIVGGLFGRRYRRDVASVWR
ncbi:MAG TPA: hemerythrin domain-containing protein [Actinomycetes bacterium]|jgi:hemerythrin-like domain-containing protein|nr:hemerythrin domain-containing protein [Actinomycetes bacterium]